VTSRLQVRVLLDTGPTPDEVAAMQALFDERGMDAFAEGHSYGGPPPTSAFLIVLDVPLAPFLDRFAVRGDAGRHCFETLIRTLQAMRADAGRWGRGHGVRLEDATSGHGVLLGADLPGPAYRALMDVDLSGLDQWSIPVQLEWHPALHAWQARMTTVPRRFARRSPLRARVADSPRARQLDERQIAELWQLASSSEAPAVTWQRAQIVLLSAQGSTIASISQHTVADADRVRAVIRNFNADGFVSFDPDYDRGERPKATDAEERDARVVAGRSPAAYGLPGDTWHSRTLGDFLVAEGVVQDVDPDWLASLLDGVTGGDDGEAGTGTDMSHPTVIGSDRDGING
jgi:hypothetical protein